MTGLATKNNVASMKRDVSLRRRIRIKKIKPSMVVLYIFMIALVGFTALL